MATDNDVLHAVVVILNAVIHRSHAVIPNAAIQGFNAVIPKEPGD